MSFKVDWGTARIDLPSFLPSFTSFCLCLFYLGQAVVVQPEGRRVGAAAAGRGRDAGAGAAGAAGAARLGCGLRGVRRLEGQPGRGACASCDTVVMAVVVMMTLSPSPPKWQVHLPMS